MRPPTASEESGVLVLTFDDSNALNDGRSDAYRQALYGMIDAGPRRLVAADLSKIEYLSSSGLAALVGLKRRIDAQNGKLVLYQLQPYVADVLRVTKLNQYFTLAEDRNAALASLSDCPA